MPKCPRCMMSTCDCMCTAQALHTAYSSIGRRYARWLHRAVMLRNFCWGRNVEKGTSAGDTTLDRVIRELDQLIDEIVE